MRREFLCYGAALWTSVSLTINLENFSVADSAGPNFGPLAAAAKVWPGPNFGRAKHSGYLTQKTVHSDKRAPEHCHTAYAVLLGPPDNNYVTDFS